MKPEAIEHPDFGKVEWDERFKCYSTTIGEGHGAFEAVPLPQVMVADKLADNIYMAQGCKWAQTFAFRSKTGIEAAFFFAKMG